MSSFPNDHRKVPGIKRPYYPLPEENPTGWRCIEVHIPDGAEYHELLITVLKSLTLWFNYQRDVTHRGKLIADRFAYALGLPELGCDMNCEELTACLQPLFDLMQASLDAQTASLQQLVDQATSNAAQPPTPQPPTTVSGSTYAGALALVKRMNADNQKIYAEAEGSFIDNASEALSIVLELFPAFRDQSYDEAFELGNAYFENQVLAYNDAYPDFEVPAACDLACRIESNGGVLDIDVWGDWLFELLDVLPDNAAAKVYTKYSPLRQTFLNQIAAFFNQEISLQTYFDDLWQVYYAGTQSPVPVPPECTCDIRIMVPAATEPTPGVDSFFDVVEGTDYEIVTIGTWNGGAGGPVGPDGIPSSPTPGTILPDANRYSLAYKIGEAGDWLLCGADLELTAPESGRLYFACNDIPGAYFDNSGELAVTIEFV